MIKNILSEATRNDITNGSRRGDDYANKPGENRFSRKQYCHTASTVADYNNLDMDTFWKHDILRFNVKVQGETNNYEVTVEFDKILDKIKGRVIANDNLLNIRTIYDSLFQAISSEQVKVDCTCPDWKYREKYWATKNGFNANDAENRPADITNPNNSKGTGCKHILAVLNNVEWLQKLASVINNYVNYCKDHMEYNYSKYIFPKIYGLAYDRAIQLTIDDFDQNGNLRDDLPTDEATINLANALGKVRGRFKPGQNKNPVTQQTAQESLLNESYNYNEVYLDNDQMILTEGLDGTLELEKHFNRHCIPFSKAPYNSHGFDDRRVDNIVFTNFETPDEYKAGALQMLITPLEALVPITKTNYMEPGSYVQGKYYLLKNIYTTAKEDFDPFNDDDILYSCPYKIGIRKYRQLDELKSIKDKRGIRIDNLIGYDLCTGQLRTFRNYGNKKPTLDIMRDTYFITQHRYQLEKLPEEWQNIVVKELPQSYINTVETILQQAVSPDNSSGTSSYVQLMRSIILEEQRIADEQAAAEKLALQQAAKQAEDDRINAARSAFQDKHKQMMNNLLKISKKH